MYALSYLSTAEKIIAAYSGEEPLTAHLKKYFAGYKKAGSRDRKQISHLCYCYYRLGKAMPEHDMKERLLTGLFLCSNTPQPVLEAARPEWNEAIAQPLPEKIRIVQAAMFFDAKALFPFATQLSAAINKDAFALSMLVQPDTFIRIRPGKKDPVLAQLHEAGISFNIIDDNCIALPPSTKLDKVIAIDRDAVIQDKSSQQVLQPLMQLLPKEKRSDAWDCCAASGGKSILLHDLYSETRLTVSDIRSSILANLHKRFATAGIKDYEWFVGDVSAAHFHHKTFYDVIICDAPCSGSGTWARTPEQGYFFTQQKLQHYTGLQQRIAAKAAAQLKSGGVFLYITCSVFEAENEAVVDHLATQTGLQVKAMRYFEGYENKADTLFAAALVRL